MGGSVQEMDPAMEKRAVKKQDLVFLASGAKEKVDKTIAGMKGAGSMLAHPMSKEAREEAKAKTINDKNEIEAKQAGVRAHAQVVVAYEKAAAAGEPLDQMGGGLQGEDAPAPVDPGSKPMARSQRESAPEPSPTRSSEETEETNSNFSSSPDGSNRAQIPPTSEDYRSG